MSKPKKSMNYASLKGMCYRFGNESRRENKCKFINVTFHSCDKVGRIA